MVVANSSINGGFGKVFGSANPKKIIFYSLAHVLVVSCLVSPPYRQASQVPMHSSCFKIVNLFINPSLSVLASKSKSLYGKAIKDYGIAIARSFDRVLAFPYTQLLMRWIESGQALEPTVLLLFMFSTLWARLANRVTPIQKTFQSYGQRVRDGSNFVRPCRSSQKHSVLQPILGSQNPVKEKTVQEAPLIPIGIDKAKPSSEDPSQPNEVEDGHDDDAMSEDFFEQMVLDLESSKELEIEIDDSTRLRKSLKTARMQILSSNLSDTSKVAVEYPSGGISNGDSRAANGNLILGGSKEFNVEIFKGNISSGDVMVEGNFGAKSLEADVVMDILNSNMSVLANGDLVIYDGIDSSEEEFVV
ncbi:hypothetical protein CCACVL1_04782 [Corchorus capsularis]|uniref:Uncharacterized protein n=1 Tax=Corchorus capsularis TaxID=210143 RepID=A0A1R3JPY9_COCAP|nr:hypothetical protein CCACVL1_04782 [Corchorus capsularis]